MNSNENEIENYENQYQDEYSNNEQEEDELDEELPPEAKEYYEYKNKIDIMEKEKKLLESNLVEAKRNFKEKKKLEETKQRPFKKHHFTEYRDYEKDILNRMMDEELFGEVGTTKDILGNFVDKVLERSLYLYRNRNCHTCSKLLSRGMSTKKCPKCHHLLRELYEKQKKGKKKNYIKK